MGRRVGNTSRVDCKGRGIHRTGAADRLVLPGGTNTTGARAGRRTSAAGSGRDGRDLSDDDGGRASDGGRVCGCPVTKECAFLS